jgi:hypothetical protein
MTKFQQVRKALLDRPDYGMIGKREEMDREIWNKCVQACLDACEGQPDHNDCVREIEKLKA